VTIVMGLDQHREQITFDALDVATGEVSRGRIRPADREGVRRWLARWDGREIEAALEATTGWRFVVEELRAVGALVHLAEPAETRARRGPKKRAKTDRQDARHLRELLLAGRLPESWIPPCSSCARRSACAIRSSISAASGSSASRRRCFITACRAGASCWSPSAGHGWRRSSCRTRRAPRSRWRWRSSTRSTHSWRR
jgi:hypothetical protein